jgi:ankyrin repeat protein
LRKLLESGNITIEDLNKCDNDGRNALYMACDARNIESIQLLLSFNGIDINSAEYNSNFTPIHNACDGGHTDIVKILLSNGKGININKVDNLGRTPLSIASEQGYQVIVNLITEYSNKNNNN